MANNSTMPGIKNSWSLISFAKAHGKPQLATFKKGTPDEFKGLAFTDPSDSNNICFVSFSSNLGEKTAKEIVDMKDQLQVVELNVSAEDAAKRVEAGRQAESYCLCMVGQNAWEEIDLGL